MRALPLLRLRSVDSSLNRVIPEKANDHVASRYNYDSLQCADLKSKDVTHIHKQNSCWTLPHQLQKNILSVLVSSVQQVKEADDPNTNN